MQVSSVEEAWHMLEVGAQSRHSAETKMNDRSSRSHCMLCVKVRGQSKLTGIVSSLSVTCLHGCCCCLLLHGSMGADNLCHSCSYYRSSISHSPPPEV